MPSKPGHIFYGWVLVAVSFATIGLAYIPWQSFSIFLVALTEDLHWSREKTTLTFSIFAIFYGLVSPLTGRFTDRYSARLVMPVGATVAALGLVGSSFAQEAWMLYLSFGVLCAIGTSAIGSIPAYSTISNWFSRKRGLALGIAGSGAGVAILFLLPLSQKIILATSWRTAYVVLAALIFGIVAPLAAIFQRHKPSDMGLAPDGIAQPTNADGEELSPLADSRVVDRAWASRDWNISSAVRTGRFWFLFLGVLTNQFCLNTLIVHQVAHLVQAGYGKLLVAGLAGTVGLVGSAATILWGAVSDRFGRETAVTLGMTSMALGALALLLTRDTSTPWLVYSIPLFVGLGFGVFAPLIPSVAADLFQSRNFASIYGLLYWGNGLGSALGPWSAARIYDTTGSYRIGFATVVIVSTFCILLFWMAAPRKVRVVAGRIGKKSRIDSSS